MFLFVFKAPTIPTKRSNIFDQHRVGTEEDGFTVKAASLIVTFLKMAFDVSSFSHPVLCMTNAMLDENV